MDREFIKNSANLCGFLLAKINQTASKLQELLKMIKKYGLLFAWLVALISMLGSLFASEILHMPVCVLCWYQRIALYPLVILLGIATYREDTNIIIYALPFPVIGFFFSLYQYLEQMIPGFSPISFCTQTIPCDQIHFKIAGFITFPFLSMIACAMIFILLWCARK